MKRLVFGVLILITQMTQAQTSTDSLALLKGMWKFREVSPGLVWKHFHFSEKQLFGSNQNINVLDTKLKNKKLKFAFVSADTPGDTARKLLKTSALAEYSHALAAINGTFFNVKNAGSEDLLKIEGKLLDTTTYLVGKPLLEHKQAAITIQKRKVEIERAPGEMAYGWDKKLTQPNVMVTGPLLLWEGKPVPLKKTAFNDNRHPRTALCITKDKHLLMVTVDGRTAEAYGMSLHELTFILKQFGCINAVNLDGGGSTTMIIKDQPYSGVVNMPCDNKLFDHLGERAVSNVFVIQAR
ncbi:MAG: phosphodiester glycosidase family protein [Siphonobacter sp.]